MTTPAPARWRPSRAEILNVYQQRTRRCTSRVEGCCFAGSTARQVPGDPQRPARAAGHLRWWAQSRPTSCWSARLVEVAAQRNLPAAVSGAHGNPTTDPTEAIAALRVAGAHLRYHGDFDAPGLAMAAGAHTAGCTPFKMSARHYVATSSPARTMLSASMRW